MPRRTSRSDRNPPSGPSILEKLLEHAERIEIDGETYFRVEGDTLLDRDQLEQYAEQQESLQTAHAAMLDAGLPLTATTWLVGMTQGNKILRWAPSVELSYAVLRTTFVIGGQAGYELAVAGMRKATADWEDTCGIKFAYHPELDNSPTLNPAGALFVVREFDAHGKFIASAFFPNDPINRRRVLIDPSYYQPSAGFDKTGVLRHELGHVLGFRHEHIVSGAPPGCPDEDLFGIIQLTKYDPKSVMHYLCGNAGSWQLAITEFDRTGAQQVYGQPLNKFQFVS